MSRKDVITTEDIWKITSRGEDVFKREIGEISYTKNVKSPFRKDDNPSFRLKRSVNNIVYGQDYGGFQWGGNAIELIQELYGLNFSEAINKIWKDFNGDSIRLEKKIFEAPKPVKKSKPLIFEFTDCKFTDLHKKYMDKYKLDETYCNYRDIWAVDKFAINKKVQKLTNGEYRFAYVPRDCNGKELEGKLKILSLGPSVLKENKWRTNVPNKFLWHCHTIPKDCKTLFVVKSVKDGAVLNKHYGLHCIELQSENAKIFLRNNVEITKSLAQNIVLCLGADDQAINTAEEIVKETGFDSFTIPRSLYQNFELEDTADYVANFSIKSLGNLLKNYIK